MSSYPPPGQGAGGVGRRIEEAIELIEMELRHAVAYVNDAVIPEVRKESISAMRTMAETLQRLADRAERGSTHGSNAGSSGVGNSGARATEQPKEPRF